jgi:hypothetical protein
MKRQFVIPLFATLIMCFGSGSVFADMNINYWYISGSTYPYLFIEYDDGNMGYDSGITWADFDYVSPPPSHDYLYELTYDDGVVSGYASGYYGYALHDNGFTIDLSIDCWVKNPQGIDPLLYSFASDAGIRIDGYIDLGPSEKALFKMEIIGATWDSTIDPYFSLYSDTPLTYDGQYYTTYLNDDDWFGINALLSSYDFPDIDISRDCQINCTFEVVPLPSAVILAGIGLAYSGRILKRQKKL